MKSEKITNALKVLKSGGVIAFPTETVFGIGASLNSPKGIRKIFRIKGRPKNKPLQVLVATLEQAKKLGDFSRKALEFARKKWPGPYTLVLPKTRKVSKLVTGGSKKVGLRMPDHKLALALIKKCGPIVASSANRSGTRPALTVKEVKQKLPEVAWIVSGKVKKGKASKVIDTTRGFKTLRA